MDPEQTDAKTEVEDSSSTTVQTIMDVKPGTSSSPTGVAPKSLDEVAAAFMAEGTASPTEPVEEADETASKKDEAKASVADDKKEEVVDEEESTKDEVVKTEPAAKDESIEDPTKPPPFHEHPRWKEMIAERDRLKPAAEAHERLQQFCRTHDIPAQEVDVMFDIAGLMRTNPQKAYDLMVPIVKAMEEHLGLTLPSDLEADVSAGKRTPDQATEVAKLRAEAKQARALAEQTNKRVNEQSVQNMTRSVQEWIGNKQRTDLGFKPKINGASDGLWEFVDALYAQQVTAKPPTTATEAVAYAENAYARAKKAFAPAVPIVPKKTLSSEHSSTATTKKPRTIDEVAMQFAGATWPTRKQS